MKKIVLLLIAALSLPIGIFAQGVNDDLYFVPSKNKKEAVTPARSTSTTTSNTNVYTSPGSTVVVQERNGTIRDVDEYNRRYSSQDNDFSYDNDTLYLTERQQPALEGECLNVGFNVTQDDYVYA